MIATEQITTEQRPRTTLMQQSVSSSLPGIAQWAPTRPRKYLTRQVSNWQTLVHRAARTAEGCVKPETARTRANIFDLFCRFSRANHPEGSDTLTEVTVLAFLQHMVDERVETNGSLAGVVTYARYLRVRLREVKQETTALDRFVAALNLKGALVPKRQARPITRDELFLLKGALEWSTWLAVWLAWKSASRLGEVLHLQGQNFLLQPQGNVVIQWLQTTKAGGRRPFALSNLTEIEANRDDQEEVASLLKLQPQEYLCNTTTQTIVRRIHAVGLEEITGHSLKRGAILALPRLVASGVIEPDVLARIAKHSVREPLLPDTTVRYGSDKTAMARIGQTHTATRML